MPKSQLYATIRECSKYSNQQSFDENQTPIPFPVIIDFETDPYWPVKGGIGENYAFYDVDLWIEYKGMPKFTILVAGKHYNKLPIHEITG